MYIFIFVIFTIIFILLLLPTKVKIFFYYDSNAADFNFRISSLFGLLKYNYTSSLTSVLEKIVTKYSNKQDNKRFMIRARHLFPKIKKFVFKHVKIHETRLRIGIGLDDAFITAIIISFISIISGSFFSYLSKKMLFNMTEIQMLPLYNSMQLSINGSCIIETKLGNIISIIIKTLMDKPKRGCESDGTTDSKSYENYYGKH